MKYTTIFSSNVRPIVSEEKDKYLALASAIEVAQFVPEIDTEKQVDLLPLMIVTSSKAITDIAYIIKRCSNITICII